MTIYIVSAFNGSPVAVFSDSVAAYNYVQKQPGKFNNWEIAELELNAEVPAPKRARASRKYHAPVTESAR